MKKILLMLAMLLPCVGVWAEVASLKVSTDAEKHYYVIKNLRSHKFAYYNGDNAQLKQNGNPSSITAEADLDKYLWYVTEATGGADGAYMLHNAATSKVYAAYNSFTETGAVVYIKENPHKSGYVCVSSNTDATTSKSCWDDSNGGSVGTWAPTASDNAGTSWEFIEIEDQNATVAYTLTDNADNSFNSTFIGWSREMYPVVTGVADYTLSNIVYGDRNVTATVNFPFPVSKVDGTTNWTFIFTNAFADGDRAYLYVNDSGKIVSKSTKAANGTYGYLPTGVEGEVQKWMWAIYPTLTNGKFTFQIKNASAGMYVPSATAQKTTIYVSDEAGNYSWGVCIGSNNGFYLDGYTNLFWGAASSTQGEKDGLIWNKTGSSHKGCNLEFTAPIYRGTINITDNSGNEYSYLGLVNYTEDETDVEYPNLTGILENWITDVTWNEGVCNIVVTFPFPVSNNSQLNATQIANFNNNQLWNAVGNDVKVQKIGTPSSSEIATSLWGIYPTFENGAYTYKVKNVATQSWVTVNKTTNSFNTQGTVTLTEEGTKLDIINWLGSPCFKLINETVYLTINGSSDSDVYLATYTGGNNSHGGNKLHFPKATYTVTVGATRYATLYTPIAGTFAGDVETYAIENASNSSAVLTAKDGVAANQGAIVEATPGTYTFTAGAVSSDWTSNQLLGSAVNTYVAGEAYVLALVDGNAALTLAELNKNANGETGDSHFLNNAGKAYLPASAVVSGARSLFFNNGTTGIEETIVAPVFNANAPIYDLSGRRVMNAVKGGIYIQNGKKFIVK